MNAQLEKLQARFMKATTDAEREDVRKEMRKLCDADAPGLAAAALESVAGVCCQNLFQQDAPMALPANQRDVGKRQASEIHTGGNYHT